MSLILARSVLSVGLCPDQVGLVWRAREAGDELIRCEASDANTPWLGPVETLRDWMLDARPFHRPLVRISLSNRFVRYALSPWPEAPLRGDEARAWDRMHLEEAYGDVTGWKILAAGGAFGSPRVLCAVPESLLAGLQGLQAGRRFTLGAVVPCFVGAWNRWHRTLTAGQLFGVAESDRLVLGRQGPRGWESLRMVACAMRPDALTSAVRRELAVLGAAEHDRVTLFAPGLAGVHGDISPGVDWIGSEGAGEASALQLARQMALP